MGKVADLTGRRFGKLVVKEFYGMDERHRSLWLCECDCGNTKVVPRPSLLSGSTTSCGCKQHERKFEDLTGQRFGNLVVREFYDVNQHRMSRWVCDCDCGNTVIVVRSSLVNGSTTSCGCKRHDIDDLTGERFGRLVVVGLDSKDQRGQTHWLCECDCGNEVVVRRSNLISGKTKSCGCIRREDLTGKRFGRLTVLKHDYVDYNGISFWKCVCDCGNEVVVRSTSLKNGMTKSCGCYKREQSSQRFTKHGLSDHPLYVVWTDMKRRCCNESDPAWYRYGGRGITVCEEWVNDFKAFYDWAIDHGWEPGLTLDRRDNNEGYDPWNCRFVSETVQANNRCSNRLIRYAGETNTIAEWATIFDINYFTLRARINRGDMRDFEEYFGFVDPDGGDVYHE